MDKSYIFRLIIALFALIVGIIGQVLEFVYQEFTLDPDPLIFIVAGIATLALAESKREV